MFKVSSQRHRSATTREKNGEGLQHERLLSRWTAKKGNDVQRALAQQLIVHGVSPTTSCQKERLDAKISSASFFVSSILLPLRPASHPAWTTRKRMSQQEKATMIGWQGGPVAGTVMVVVLGPRTA